MFARYWPPCEDANARVAPHAKKNTGYFEASARQLLKSFDRGGADLIHHLERIFDRDRGLGRAPRSESELSGWFDHWCE
jgi:hypothetical protein